MKLPLEISPNPLVSSTVEIRFISELEKLKLFPLVYQKFQNFLPNLNENIVPKQIKELDPQFAYSADYILSNNDYSLAFGINVISFENVNDYKLWGNYFPFIKESLTRFFELGIIKYIDRIGVRYGSVFDKNEDVSKVITYLPAVPIDGYEQKFGLFRCNLIKDEFNFLLQIADNVKVTKSNKLMSGTYIDIDGSYTNRIEPNKEVFDIIDNLHQQQKEVFFNLLKKSFLDTLTLTY